MNNEAIHLALEALKTCEIAWPGTRFKSKYFDEDKVKEAIKALEACSLKYDMDTGRMIEVTLEEL